MSTTAQRQCYPVAVLEDRYSGVYSGGRWVAVAEWDRRNDVCSTRLGVVEREANGDDTDAMEFWDAPPTWAAVGSTPDAALSALYAKHETTRPAPVPADG